MKTLFIMKKGQLLLIFILLTLATVSIQAQQRSSGTSLYLNDQILADANRATALEEIERHTQEWISDGQRTDDIIYIPVVFHVVYGQSSQNISAAQIASQIQVLNEDYRRMNADADNVWSQAADTKIEFYLATIDPNGAPTNGITRRPTSVSAFGTNDNIKFQAYGGTNAWPSDKYLNIWIGKMSGGLQGYAQYPGGNPSTDGVVLDYRRVGSIGTAQAPFDLGRSGTQEVGHWLNLNDIWGNVGCGSDDNVMDTPLSDAPNYGCNLGHISCGSTDMVQNFMDYSHDACMNIFTTGQKNRMRALFAPGGARESFTIPTDNTPDCDGKIVFFDLVLDNYGTETTWAIKDANNTVLESGGTYQNGQAGTMIQKELCLPNGCYTFEINDHYGDGICCNYGQGGYQFTHDGNILAAGGNFDYQEVITFCLTDGEQPTCNDGVQNGDETGVDCGGLNCPPCEAAPCEDYPINLSLTFDGFPSETSWSLEDSEGNILDIGEGYQNQEEMVEEDFCLEDGCYTFIVEDAFGDGMCCNYGNGSYVLTGSGFIISTGGEFEYETSNTFCINNGMVSTCDDGIQNGDETDIDCGGSCAPCAGECTYELIDEESFENGWGMWIDGGSDALKILNAQRANTGNYSVRLRDNSGSSKMTTVSMDLSEYEELTVDFSFVTKSFDNYLEDFWLQISYDNGATYTTVEDWVYTIDFQNSTRYNESVTIMGSFTSNTRLRFRCDASSNNDKIYIDDVVIHGCTSNLNLHEQNDIIALESLNAPTEIAAEQTPKLDLKVFPNPSTDLVNVRFRFDDDNQNLLQVTDVSGKIILTQQLFESNASFNVHQWIPGMYFVQVSNNKETITKKLIVK